MEDYYTYTTIAITQQTRKQLESLSTKDSTFNDIIHKLIKKWNDEN